MGDIGHNPFETPRPRGTRSLQALLRVVVAVQCFGMAALHLHAQQPDLFCELIGKSRDFPADQIANMSRIGAYTLTACGVFTLLRPTNLVLLALILYQSGTALAVLVAPDSSMPAIQIALQATRCLAPFALLLVDFWPPRIKATLVMCLSSVSLLKLATAATFIAHGILCLQQLGTGGPEFDLFEKALQKGIRQTFTSEEARNVFLGFAVIELGFAMSLLSSRSKGILFSCVLIGLIRAASFTVAIGPSGWAQSLSWVSLPGAPLACLMFAVTSMKEQLPIYLPEVKKQSPAPPPVPLPPGKKR